MVQNLSEVRREEEGEDRTQDSSEIDYRFDGCGPLRHPVPSGGANNSFQNSKCPFPSDF